MDFGRVITAMVTPFDSNLRVDREQTKKLIDYLIEEQASDSLVICGTTGESPTLSDEEKLELFHLAVEHARGRCRIIAGTGSYDTAHSVHLTKEAEAAGVDGILLVAPYYNRPNQEGLYRHFRTIAEASSLPIMLYNIPGRTGVTIAADTTVRLAQIDNIVATKEAHSDFDLLTGLIVRTPERFQVYSGDDNMTLPLLAIGGRGIVSVASHVVGRQIQQMIDSFTKGEVEQASRINRELYPIFRGMFISPNPVPVKYALKLHGIDAGGSRMPMVELTEQEMQTVRSLFGQ